MSRDFGPLSQFFEEGIPFNAHLGIKVESLTPGEVVLRVPFQPHLIGDARRPAIHRGVLSALADAAGGLAVWSTLAPSSSLSTIDLRVDYLRPGGEHDVFCHAEVVRIGNRVGVSAMRVYQESAETLIADARGVYNVKRAEDSSTSDTP